MQPPHGQKRRARPPASNATRACRAQLPSEPRLLRKCVSPTSGPSPASDALNSIAAGDFPSASCFTSGWRSAGTPPTENPCAKNTCAGTGAATARGRSGRHALRQTRPGAIGRVQMESRPRLLSVNVGMPRDIRWNGRTVRTAIWKAPAVGRCRVRRLNLEGDGQGDLAGHGGEQRAIFVYQTDSYRYWQEHLNRIRSRLRKVRRELYRRRAVRRRRLHR